MLRTEKRFSISDFDRFKTQLLDWSQQFSEVIWLDSNNPNHNNSQYNWSDFDAILAVKAHSKLESSSDNAFNKLKSYRDTIQDYTFGYLSYDLKNDIEHLHSNNLDHLNFPDVFFFQPEKLICIKKNEIHFKYIDGRSIDSDFHDISNHLKKKTKAQTPIKIKLRIHKDEYFDKIQKVLNHIHRGDIYEVCFCQEFYAEESTIDPVSVFEKLNAISRTPFASFLKLNDKYLISASPERFMKRRANTILSQPIKGTIKRGTTYKDDELLKQHLASDSKERAENIMIVDLVRNDLSKTAIAGTVKTVELCKVYTFKQVHQLISTVQSKVHTATNSVDIIQSLFPMGSMTGAPKIAAMKIIEELEETKRGLFSGALGYFSPEQDFDFNVVIRSILYNASSAYVSYSVGGAITAKSTAEKEYEECLLKARALRQVLLDAND